VKILSTHSPTASHFSLNCMFLCHTLSTGDFIMARRTTIGIKNFSREQYNAYYREVSRRKRERDREARPTKIPPTHKLCTRCNVEYPMTEEFFYKTAVSTLGARYFQSWCKACRKTYQSPTGKLATEGSCDICWKKGKRFHIYNSLTTQILGALCGQCRLMMNVSGNSPDLLRRAAEYLEERS
jgi:hypothetical protein